MTTAFERFDFFLNQLDTLLQAAEKQKNPALYLYKQNARTPLFMLEGLCKLYAALHNKKKFSKLKEKFKLLEDAIGAIDYYDVIAHQLSANKKIPAAALQYLQAQTREKIQHLNEILVEEKWIGPGKKRIAKTREKLEEANWLSASKEMNGIASFYQHSIHELNDFVKNSRFHFSNMEADVHELRRKLRWLSIYPQALKGAVQLAAHSGKEKHLLPYLTKEIVDSPFNVMPPPGAWPFFLLLDKSYFLSLSWMISELGKLKDRGLTILALQEALLQTSQLKEEAALKKATLLTGNSKTPLSSLLSEAELVCRKYFRESNLDNLVVGIVSTVV